jgi:opacity protein-like surface antigen
MLTRKVMAAAKEAARDGSRPPLDGVGVWWASNRHWRDLCIMDMKKKIIVTILVCGTLCMGLGSADAQNRGDRWEFSLGGLYQFSEDLETNLGSTLETDGELGLIVDFGYNIDDHLAVNFGFTYTGVGYDANVVTEEDGVIGISGSFDQMVFSANAIYHFGDGWVTPYIGAGIGYTWIDTNIPNGPSQGVCWWDPWWGWVCYETYPTKTVDAFSYQAILGVRYEFNPMNFMKFSYTSQWMDFSGPSNTPRYDVIGIEFGWMF